MFAFCYVKCAWSNKFYNSIQYNTIKSSDVLSKIRLDKCHKQRLLLQCCSSCRRSNGNKVPGSIRSQDSRRRRKRSRRERVQRKSPLSRSEQPDSQSVCRRPKPEVGNKVNFIHRRMFCKNNTILKLSVFDSFSDIFVVLLFSNLKELRTEKHTQNQYK